MSCNFYSSNKVVPAGKYGGVNVKVCRHFTGVEPGQYAITG